MRGKVAKIAHIPNRIRITPAYAGKSHVVKPFVYPVEDHPRVCGEKGIRSSFNS